MLFEEQVQVPTKYSFSGHESFQCRQLWLKKGFDYLQSGRSFSDEDAVVELGVGKNMVTSIKYWLKAFNIINGQDEINEFARLLLLVDGLDEYLEDDASLWLLHYHLVKTGFASTYSLIFNQFRWEKAQFSRDNYLSFVKRKSETEKKLNYNEKTTRDDFDVFKKMYLSSTEEMKNIEDSFSGLLTDLQLVKSISKGREEIFYIEDTERKNLPVEILFYAILEKDNLGSSINLKSLEQEDFSLRSIFAITRSGLIAKIKEAAEKYPYIIYKDDGGVREIQFKEKVTSLQMLKNYYAK